MDYVNNITDRDNQIWLLLIINTTIIILKLIIHLLSNIYHYIRHNSHNDKIEDLKNIINIQLNDIKQKSFLDIHPNKLNEIIKRRNSSSKELLQTENNNKIDDKEIKFTFNNNEDIKP